MNVSEEVKFFSDFSKYHKSEKPLICDLDDIYYKQR